MAPFCPVDGQSEPHKLSFHVMAALAHFFGRKLHHGKTEAMLAGFCCGGISFQPRIDKF